MANNRIPRINDDIQRSLSELLRSVKDPRVQQGMISITRVDTTGDLKFAKIYISVMGLENEREMTRGLRSAGPWLRRELAQRLHLRATPELIFELDHSIERGAHVSELLDTLNIEYDEDGEDGEELEGLGSGESEEDS